MHPCAFLHCAISRSGRAGALCERARPDQAKERGPSDDIDLLYRGEAAALRRRLRARLGSSEEAGDLVQEAFARLLGAHLASSVRDPAAFLNRIVRNLLIDRSRRKSARAPHVELAEGDAAVPPGQSDAIEVEQMRERYREAVSELPERMREVFILHRVHELGYREIAARLDISVRTVEWHIAQAIVRISRGLDEG
jgi:RNA polymerase sigma-70 factor (ECF subfamily)